MAEEDIADQNGSEENADLNEDELFMYGMECGYFADKESRIEAYRVPSGEMCREIVSRWDILPSFGVEEEMMDSLPDSFFMDYYFSVLMFDGFRRNGQYVYKNHCRGCNKCVPIRICVEDFVPSKSQRKSVRVNEDVRVEFVTEPEKLVTEEKIALLKKYNYRHQGELSTGEEVTDRYVKDELYDLNGVEQGPEGFTKCMSGTANMEYYIGDRLVAVGIVDIGYDCFSSAYFYYDTDSDMLKRSLGTFSVMKEIEFCREEGIDWYYLGLYLADCRKMNYKAKYKPHQFLVDGEWVEGDDEIDLHVGQPD